jgi:hypothetical protein
MDMPNESELVSIFTKLINRHFIGDTGESQLSIKDSSIESSGRASTAKSSTITTTTTTSAADAPTAISLKEKLSTQALKRLEHLRSIIERIVKGTVELNDRMRNIYQINNQRIHYVFSMKQLTQLFRNLCISLTPDCSIDDILYLWHHECDWLYGKRLYDQIDQQRYQQLYKTIVKKYFTNMINEQQTLLTQDQQFSNLQVTESGLLIRIFIFILNLFFFFKLGMIVANLSRDSQNYLTDNYTLVTDRNRIETLVRNAIIEYNKEKPKITFPLYPVCFFLFYFFIFFEIKNLFSVILNYYVVYVIQFKQLMDIVV